MSGSNTDSEQREKLLRESLMAFGESYRRWFYAIDDNEAIDRAVQRFAIRTAGQSTASQPTHDKNCVCGGLACEVYPGKDEAGDAPVPAPTTLADDALAKVLAYCKNPDGFEGGGYAFAYLDPDKVVRIIRGQEAADAKPSEPKVNDPTKVSQMWRLNEDGTQTEIPEPSEPNRG